MHRRKWIMTVGIAACAASAAAAAAGIDFGLFRDRQLEAHSVQLFGIVSPVEASSELSISAAEADSDPLKLVTLANGLQARVVADLPNVPANVDMMVLWPNGQNPTHLIACNEQGPAAPGLVRIRLSDGFTETILAGTDSCDPVRRTAWGTIVFGEEDATGWLLELIDPLATTGVTFDRTTGILTGANAANVTTRPAVGRLAFEGLALLPNGVLYYGDENRPANGNPGGAYFKFIPTTPWTGGTLGSLGESPLAAGSVYGLRLGKRNGNSDYGQGSNTGLGTWIPIPPASLLNLRAGTSALKLTGYYRPEDAEIDPSALAEGQVRFCGNNTGNEATDHNWGETICVTDGTLAQATANTAVPEAQYFVMGSWDFAMMDNLAFQPERHNVIIHEDGDAPEAFGRNNDLWSCLPDADDADTLSDGCVRIATLNDLSAEWTGGIFDRYGDHFYVSVQHNVTGHGIVLDITGWR